MLGLDISSLFCFKGDAACCVFTTGPIFTLPSTMVDGDIKNKSVKTRYSASPVINHIQREFLRTFNGYLT